MLDQMIEQLVFGGAQMHFAAGAAHAMGGAVHLDIADADHVLGQAGADAAQHGAQARQKLGHRERLGEIIVGAGVEAADAVGLLAARRQHDDRHVAGFLAAAQAAADFDAGELRQHPVQQHQIGLFLGGDQQRFLAVLRFQHAIAFALQIVAQQGDQGAFVFGDQNGRLQLMRCWPRRARWFRWWCRPWAGRRRDGPPRTM